MTKQMKKQATVEQTQGIQILRSLDLEYKNP